MCKFCESTKSYNTLVTDGHYLEITMANEREGITIWAYNNLSGEYTDNYYPKYCPECGRKLRDD